MSASIPLNELRSLIQDAFPGAAEARAWLRDRWGVSDEAERGAVDVAVEPLSAQPAALVLERLLDAAPFLVDRVRVLAVSLDLTLPGPVLDEADFAMRRGVSLLVNLLAGGDYALAYRFFHRRFAWGAKAADVEPGHALASLDRLSDNLLQLGVHKHEEMFKVLLAEHPGHAEEIQRLARLMGHFNLAPPPPPLPDPVPHPPPAPSLLDRLFALLHRARVAVVAWPKPSRLALVVVPCLAISVVFLTASAPADLVYKAEITVLKLQVEGLTAVVGTRDSTIEQQREDLDRLEAKNDELKQEIAALTQKDVLTQQALADAKKQAFDLTTIVETLRRRIKRLVDDNVELKNALLEALSSEPHQSVLSPPNDAPPPATGLNTPPSPAP